LVRRKPIRIDSIQYERKIAVVVSFGHTVPCLACPSLDNGAKPRGRSFRFAFYRASHKTSDGRTWALRLCPSRVACLRR